MLKLRNNVVFEKIMFKYVIIKKTDKKRRIFYIKYKKVIILYLYASKHGSKKWRRKDSV